MTHRDRSFALLLLCFFLSGLAALIYQTAWTREFAFVFGTSELAIATVLAAYMGGLAAGAALAGRYARRIERPVRAYGLLELGIALAALAVPLGLALSRKLYVAIFGGLEMLPEAGGLPTALFYLACSFAILLVPTAMMGATLPLLARHAVHEDHEIGARIGVLYAINTAGAVVGTLLAAFWILPSVGLRLTIAIAAATNGLVFAAAWALSRSLGPHRPEAAPPAPLEAVGRAGWILPLIGISGAVSFGYEVIWVRLVSQLVGSSVQAFSTMLASFLAGIAIGSALAARYATTPRRAATGFVLAQLGIAALSLGAFVAVERIPELSDTLGIYRIDRIWIDVTACVATLFPAALCIGATFPFAVRVLARGADDAGPASARVYAANTVGSIVGSIGAGFFLVPALGFAGAMTLCAGTNLALAGAAAWVFEPRRPPLVALAAAAIATLALLPPSPPWAMLRATSMGDGGVRSRAWGPVQHFGVGRSATVLLTDQRLSYGLRTNGLPEAGIARPGTWLNRYPMVHWLGALPVLARPEARTLLLVGLGGGGALELAPSGYERIDVVELEPEVLAANRSVSGLRQVDPLADPRVHVTINDARNALLLATTRYDAIVSQPSHPWAGGAAHLYTREFFELVRSRLSPDGVFVQWIGMPFVNEALYRSLLATLLEVFPHVRSYEPPPRGSALFVASTAPFDMEASVARALSEHAEDFARIGILRSEDVTSSLRLDEIAARELAANAPLNTDGHNRLQNLSARVGERSLLPRIDEVTAEVDPLVLRRPASAEPFSLLRRLTPARATRVAEALEDPADREVGLALAEIAEGKRSTPARRLREVLVENPRHVEGRAALLRLNSHRVADGGDPSEILAPPISDSERAIAAGWLARAKDRSGEELRALENELAAIPFDATLGRDALRLRIQARILGGDADAVREAVALADASLGDRPDNGSLLLRAEAYAAAGEHAAVLETISLLDQRRVTPAYVGRARQLAFAVPEDDPELVSLRRRALWVLGIDPRSGRPR